MMELTDCCAEVVIVVFIASVLSKSSVWFVFWYTWYQDTIEVSILLVIGGSKELLIIFCRSIQCLSSWCEWIISKCPQIVWEASQSVWLLLGVKGSSHPNDEGRTCSVVLLRRPVEPVFKQMCEFKSLIRSAAFCVAVTVRTAPSLCSSYCWLFWLKPSFLLTSSSSSSFLQHMNTPQL